MAEGRAIVCHDTYENGGWRMEEIFTRKPQKGELLVDMVASGICHTDALIGGLPDGAAPIAFYPRVLGHEGSAYVREVGEGVTVAKPGDPVLLSYAYCNDCALCKDGHYSHCMDFNPLNFGDACRSFGLKSKGGEIDIGGAFFGQSSFGSVSIVKECSVVNAKDLVKDKNDLELFAPLGCGIQTGSGTVINAAKAGTNDIVVIMGLGGVGLSAIMGAKIAGCRKIIGLDRIQSRLDLATELGATDVIDGSKLPEGKELGDVIKEIADGIGPTITIDTTGVPTLIKAGVQFTRNRGAWAYWKRNLFSLVPFSLSNPVAPVVSLRRSKAAIFTGTMGDISEVGNEYAVAPKLPIPGKRNVLITSALPYVNNVPHLGNLIGSVLSADVFARYCRRRLYNVIYICGTDEYGTATETKAMEEHCTPRQICDKYHAIHKEIYEWFDISFDKFGRTSTPQQTYICQAIFQNLWERNWLSENTMQQLYCDTCSRFLADRFVEGVCPTPGCGYEDARGDQCESCGKLLNPTELLKPRCKVCRNPPRIRDTEHLFLELPKLKDRLEEYIKNTSVIGGWSQNAVQSTNAWTREGLKPRCITRDLKWGVPVPLEKFKDKVFYVWFDAPIGYVSITACYTKDWEKWWKDPENVELFQFMGKDNVPFHTVMFPSTLLGTGENWTLMKTISVTEYLNYEAGKFSKSKGMGVFGNDAKDTNIPVEVWRYYLLTNRPEVSDTLFTWADLQAKQNSELLKNLGNFVHRSLSFLAKPSGEGYGSIVPDAPGAEAHKLTVDLGERVGTLVEQYVEAMEKVKLKQGLKTAMSISSEGNCYLQDSQFWKLYKEDPAACAIVVKTSIGLVHLLATLFEPFMPSFSHKVLGQLNLPYETLSLSDEKGDVEQAGKPWKIVPAGHKIGKPEPLFSEMKDEEVNYYRRKFAGSQADRVERAEAEAINVAEQIKKTTISDGVEKKGAEAKKSAEAKRKSTTSTPKDLGVSIARIDIRVGLITNVQKHPDADSLYVEEIDVGEPAKRTVVSGLVKYIPLEEMQNRKVLVVCNLKPASMRGIKSQAMVLAASNDDHTIVELVSPPEDAPVGERLKFPGFDGEPDEVLNPKKKVWETVQPDLHTTTDLIACYKGVPFTTSAGVCRVSSVTCGSIK